MRPNRLVKQNKTRHPFSASFQNLMALEPRLMLAGDVGAEVQVAAQSNVTDQATAQIDSEHSVVEDAVRSQGESSIVFIDAGVDEVNSLLTDLPANADVVLLSSREDGLSQITKTLATRRNVSCIHIISHGESGRLQLGNRVIDRDSLASNRDQLTSWRQALASDADILLYGCQIAAGTEGQHFVTTLAQLTSADVAASDDRTGNARQGGDWVLETHVGLIENQLAITREMQVHYAGVLPITVFAAGHTGSETMALQIDGNTVAEWTNIGGDFQSNSFFAYNYENDQPISADRVRIAFTNDLYIENQVDRNLIVDRVVIDGIEFQTEADAVYSTGTWRPGIGVQPGNPQSEWLHSGGYFQYSDNARSAEHFVTIYAAGQTGTESMQLAIDGKVVQQWDNAGGEIASRNFGTFVYSLGEAVDANRIRVQLVDGQYQEGYDRNLVVDKLMIDGVAYETEADNVYSTGTWRAEDGVALGYRQSEWLHASGFFQYDANTRTYDGVGNNIQFAQWGANDAQLIRVADVNYADGISEPVSDGLPSPREISNVIVAQSPTVVGNPEALSALVHIWGQFIDHDLDLTEPPSEGGESLPIVVPIGDPWFDPTGTGTAVIAMTRSEENHGTGTSTSNPRQHYNAISAFLDGSMVYGSTQQQAFELREGTGGRMRVSAGDLLPLDSEGGFLAGDIRAMENVNLTSMHTLFVREHNYWAEQLRAQFPELSDEALFQEARKIVVAEIQAITYQEFLPALLGEYAIGDYAGYDPTVNPGITTEFSTAAYRVGHTLLNDEIEFMNTYGNHVADNISLAGAFFNPSILQQYGIDSSLKFAASVQAQAVDNQIVDSLRNFLFGQPGSGGFDLASLNINRGRDHGLADYNSTREAYGLTRVSDFSEITSDTSLQEKLRSLYGSVDQIDLWVGGLAEDAAEGRSLGETFTTILVDQFQRLRDGDRLWYENTLSSDAIVAIKQTSLGDIISRNTTIHTIQDDVFHVWGVIEGRVSLENQSNGNQGTPISNVLIQLYNADGEFVAETQSDSQGFYRFNQITRVGAYRVLLQLDGQYLSNGSGYQDVWFYEGNLVLGGIDFGLVANLV